MMNIWPEIPTGLMAMPDFLPLMMCCAKLVATTL